MQKSFSLLFDGNMPGFCKLTEDQFYLNVVSWPRFVNIKWIGRNTDIRVALLLFSIRTLTLQSLWNESLRVLYLNTRSLKAIVASSDNCARKVCKMSLLQRLAYGKDFDVISLCETCVNPTVLDSEILSGYNICRRDRDDRGGGVSIAVE